ncbi:MAG: cytochrome c [Chloroflexi bacterium]|nr:cytochrome c [Chloroflexota bacterium]
MIGNLIALLILLAIVVLFGYLAKRSWGTKRGALLKWVGVILSGLLTLVFLLVFVAALIGFLKTTIPASNPVSNIKVQSTPEQLARGETLAQLCSGCHSPEAKPPLIGGKENFAQIPNGPNLGTVYSPNLTPAGEMKDWTDGEIIRAIREGVHKNGRPLIVMPTTSFSNMSDSDVQALVAYLRSQPATKHAPQNDLNSNSVNLLAFLFLAGGVFETSVQPPITQPIPDPPTGVNVQRGKYLATVLACQDCHGKTFTGGNPSGFAPVGPNIVALTTNWSDADFIKLMRTGTDPADNMVSENMPWTDYTKFSDDELKSILMFLKSLPKEAPKQ